MVPASLLPASIATGHPGIVLVDGYGVASPGTSTEGLNIEVPVAVSVVNLNSGIPNFVPLMVLRVLQWLRCGSCSFKLLASLQTHVLLDHILSK